MSAGVRRFWSRVLAVAGLYLGIQYGSLILSGGWQKYFNSWSYKNALDWPTVSWPEIHQAWNLIYWDTVHYVALALNPQCSAWYPLWPMILRLFGPFTAPDGVRIAFLLSQVLFLVSLPLTLFVFERIIRDRTIAFLSFALYALGPNAIFHSIGYTESLFGLLSSLFLLLLYWLEEARPTRLMQFALYSALLLTTLLLNLNRPVLIQAVLAALAAVGSLFLLARRPQPTLAQSVQPLTPSRPDLEPTPKPAFALKTALFSTGTVILGSGLGYSLYGLFCLGHGSTFLGPFHEQVAWGRTVAFRPMLLLLPRSLLMDLHGLYLPAALVLLTGLLVYAYLRRQPKLSLPLPKNPWAYLLMVHPLVFTLVIGIAAKLKPSWLTPTPVETSASTLSQVGRFSVLFALFFSAAHSAINLTANLNALYSTARHYFGSPFGLLSLGVLLTVVASPQLNRVVWTVGAIATLLLAQHWFSFAGDHWLG